MSGQGGSLDPTSMLSPNVPTPQLSPSPIELRAGVAGMPQGEPSEFGRLLSAAAMADSHPTDAMNLEGIGALPPEHPAAAHSIDEDLPSFFRPDGAGNSLYDLAHQGFETAAPSRPNDLPSPSQFDLANQAFQSGIDGMGNTLTDAGQQFGLDNFGWGGKEPWNDPERFPTDTAPAKTYPNKEHELYDSNKHERELRMRELREQIGTMGQSSQPDPTPKQRYFEESRQALAGRLEKSRKRANKLTAPGRKGFLGVMTEDILQILQGWTDIQLGKRVALSIEGEYRRQQAARAAAKRSAAKNRQEKWSILEAGIDRKGGDMVADMADQVEQAEMQITNG